VILTLGVLSLFSGITALGGILAIIGGALALSWKPPARRFNNRSLHSNSFFLLAHVFKKASRTESILFPEKNGCGM
jgi:hypothetical protein